MNIRKRIRLKTIASALVAISTIELSAATPPETVTTTDEDSATVGGLSFMQHQSPVTSKSGHTFWAYITPATSDPAGSGATTDATVVIRQISNTGVKTSYTLRNPNDTSANYNIKDDPYHVGPSIGIDRNGYIHVAVNMHYHGWQYWRSVSAYNVADGFQWKGCTLVAGVTEPNVTGAPSATSPPGYMISYPWFVNDRDGRLYVTYRQRLTSSWGVGCTGGGMAQYVESTDTWKAMGGTDYTIPNGLNPYNPKSPTLFYHTDGPTDIPAYQSYNIFVAVDYWNQMHLSTTLFSSAGGVQTNGPTQIVYLKAMPGTVNADGSRNWTFRRPDNVAIADANLPAQLGQNETWTVYTRPATNKTAFTTYCGVGYNPGSPGVPRPMVEYSEGVGTAAATAQRKHFYQHPTTGIYGWYAVTNMSSQFNDFTGQGNVGGGYITSLVRSSSNTTVYRSNDNGDTNLGYNLGLGAYSSYIDHAFSLSQITMTNNEQLRVLLLGHPLTVTDPASSTTGYVKRLQFTH